VVGKALLMFGLALACAVNNAAAGDGAAPTQRGPAMVLSPEAVSHGVGFRIAAEPVWQVPADGSARDIALDLQLRNGTGSDLYFYLFETVRPMIRLPSGRIRECGFARDMMKRGPGLSDAVGPGQSLIIRLAPKLSRRHDGLLDLSGDDGFGGIWSVSGFDVGRISVAIRFAGKNISQTAHSVWAGDVRTAFVAIIVKSSV
jgi:hypothetical protein